MILLVKAHNNYIDKDLMLDQRCDVNISLSNFVERQSTYKDCDVADIIADCNAKRLTGWRDGDVVGLYDDDYIVGSRETYPRFYQVRIDTKDLFKYFNAKDISEIKTHLCSRKSNYIIDTSRFKQYQVNEVSTTKIIERVKKSFDFGNIVAHNSPGVYNIASSGGHYTTLTAWEAGEQSDLVTLGGVCIANCFNLEDTTATLIQGWTTSSTYYIGVRADASYRHLGVWNGSTYRRNIATTGLTISENYVRLDDIQFKMKASTTNQACIYVASIDAGGSSIIIDKAIINVDFTNDQTNNDGITVSDADATVIIRNSVIYGTDTPSSSSDGILKSTGSVTVQNCVVRGFTTGISGTSNVITNCAVFSNGDDLLYGTVTYTASDDNDIAGAGNFQITQTASDYAAFVKDSVNGNFEPTDASSELVDTGSDLSASFGQDIRYYSRPLGVTWDVGAFETAGTPPDREIKWSCDYSLCPIDESEALDVPAHSGTLTSSSQDIPATQKYLTTQTIGDISPSGISANDEIGLIIKRLTADHDNPSYEPFITHIEIEYTK